MTADRIALVCPLDWGLGHATRCVPLIRVLQDQGFKVIVAADGRPYDFFRTEYPGIKLVRFPGTGIRYPAGSGMIFTMAAFIPRLLLGFRKEHQFLKKLVTETGASLVISDNRYGCWHPDVRSVFITHQLNIQLPAFIRGLANVLRKINYSFINKYSECWVPDEEDEGGLSGRLSHCIKLPDNCHFIGLLTRFADPLPVPEELPCKPAGIFVIISGPEPQRSIFEAMIIRQLKNSSHTAIIAGGRTESSNVELFNDRIHVFPHLSSSLIKYYIENSGYVICRSGYSTLMDLAALGKSAILVPTPGQTEQEYLAKRLSKMNIHYAMTQASFSLDEAILNSKGNKAMVIRNDMSVMKQRAARLFAQAASFRAR
ncbi:MAG: glycosyltransferase [Bacteroidetes bacterium]|nr:glycosyltransferase [Bacteroidota bacterium]